MSDCPLTAAFVLDKDPLLNGMAEIWTMEIIDNFLPIVKTLLIKFYSYMHGFMRGLLSSKVISIFIIM